MPICDNSNIHEAYFLFVRSITIVKNSNKMESSEQETVSIEPVPSRPETVIKTDMNVDLKDTTVENTSDEAPPAGGALSENMEAREEHTSDVDGEEGGAAQADTATAEAAESGQDAPRYHRYGFTSLI